MRPDKSCWTSVGGSRVHVQEVVDENFFLRRGGSKRAQINPYCVQPIFVQYRFFLGPRVSCEDRVVVNLTGPAVVSQLGRLLFGANIAVYQPHVLMKSIPRTPDT